MKGNKKYIYICLAVVIIAIVGYVAIYKLDILKNKNNDKETARIEVAKTEVSTNDELLNDPNVKYGKEETGEILKNKINLDIEENLTKKDVRNDHAKYIVIAKVSKINGATNVSKKGEGTIIATNGELEILDVLKGDIKDKKVKFSRAGGKMLYSKEEKNKMYIEEYKDGDIKLEEGKTYLIYMNFDKEENSYLVDLFEYGARELEPIQKNTLQKALSNYKTTNKVERKSKSKK